MIGTPNQIEWAEQIKRRVEAEFGRVTRAVEMAAERQSPESRNDTQVILDLLHKHRNAVLAHEDAGYFIREWQELSDQVRQMLAREPAFQAILAKRQENKRAQQTSGSVMDAV